MSVQPPINPQSPTPTAPFETWATTNCFISKIGCSGSAIETVAAIVSLVAFPLFILLTFLADLIRTTVNCLCGKKETQPQISNQNPPTTITIIPSAQTDEINGPQTPSVTLQTPQGSTSVDNRISATFNSIQTVTPTRLEPIVEEPSASSDSTNDLPIINQVPQPQQNADQNQLPPSRPASSHSQHEPAELDVDAIYISLHPSRPASSLSQHEQKDLDLGDVPNPELNQNQLPPSRPASSHSQHEQNDLDLSDISNSELNQNQLPPSRPATSLSQHEQNDLDLGDVPNPELNQNQLPLSRPASSHSQLGQNDLDLGDIPNPELNQNQLPLSRPASSLSQHGQNDLDLGDISNSELNQNQLPLSRPASSLSQHEQNDLDLGDVPNPELNQNQLPLSRPASSHSQHGQNDLDLGDIPNPELNQNQLPLSRPASSHSQLGQNDLDLGDVPNPELNQNQLPLSRPASSHSQHEQNDLDLGDIPNPELNQNQLLSASQHLYEQKEPDLDATSIPLPISRPASSHSQHEQNNLDSGEQEYLERFGPTAFNNNNWMPKMQKLAESFALDSIVDQPRHQPSRRYSFPFLPDFTQGSILAERLRTDSAPPKIIHGEIKLSEPAMEDTSETKTDNGEVFRDNPETPCLHPENINSNNIHLLRLENNESNVHNLETSHLSDLDEEELPPIPIIHHEPIINSAPGNSAISPVPAGGAEPLEQTSSSNMNNREINTSTSLPPLPDAKYAPSSSNTGSARDPLGRQANMFKILSGQNLPPTRVLALTSVWNNRKPREATATRVGTIVIKNNTYLVYKTKKEGKRVYYYNKGGCVNYVQEGEFKTTEFKTFKK